MKKLFYFILSGLTVITLLINCGSTQNNVKDPSERSKKVSSKNDSSKLKPAHRPVSSSLNDMARYIAGLPIAPGTTLDPELLNNKDWKDYVEILNEDWAKLDSSKIKKMKPWAEKELSRLNTSALFYPFAGADILHSCILFPHSKKYFLVGLEPIGTPPDLLKILKIKKLEHYFGTIVQSLTSILNTSFFRTKHMGVDFRQADVNGTIHVLLLFLERTGNSIIDIKPVAVNSKGKLITYETFKAMHNDSLRSKGAEIDFLSPDSTEHSVTYFSIDLSNGAFPGNKGFKLFIENENADVTYIKSASYLMHNIYFSDVRSFILKNSRAILQDDSGIPWKFFSDSLHTVTLFGHYTKTVAIFPHKMFQQDIYDAYQKDSAKVKDLPFGIGYKYKEGESNLMLINKK